jgi:hypothetical protein
MLTVSAGGRLDGAVIHQLAQHIGGGAGIGMALGEGVPERIRVDPVAVERQPVTGGVEVVGQQCG